jgi:hypothetical protein
MVLKCLHVHNNSAVNQKSVLQSSTNCIEAPRSDSAHFDSTEVTKLWYKTLSLIRIDHFSFAGSLIILPTTQTQWYWKTSLSVHRLTDVLLTGTDTYTAPRQCQIRKSRRREAREAFSAESEEGGSEGTNITYLDRYGVCEQYPAE